MRLSRPDSVVDKRKDQKFNNEFKGKKKHKRLDAIYEKAHEKSHRGVENVDSSELNNGGNELELRRSNRARRAPVVLDSSPLPPKKRQKVGRSVPSSVEKVRRENGAQCDVSCSSLRDLNGQNDGWRLRLRSRGNNAGFSGREQGESSLKGKRKLFQDFDEVRDDMEPQCYDKKERLVTPKSTVVKSKRPGRIKASNVMENDNQEIDLGGGVEDDKKKIRDEVLEVMDEAELQLETVLEYRSETGTENCHVSSQLDEREEIATQGDLQIEECHRNGNVETGEEPVGLEKLACDLVSDQGNVVEVDCATADQGNVAEVDCATTGQGDVAEVDCATAEQANDDGHSDKPLEDETHKKSKDINNASAAADRKPRIKLGRRCGLCGGGTDGRPPKILVLEGASSDNEAYSGSSASEEPSYDIWDGFGDQSGWLGRLLGPINDRFGIAGIWVHQQCAVWSPEVYFAGLGCLKNVRAALYRGRTLKCSRCRRPGATIGCRVDRCPKTYHLPCARARSCIFDHRKFLIACSDHRRLFQPHGIQNTLRLKKLKAKKLKLELRKMANELHRKDIEAEEKWLENCGEDEEFLKRESKRLQRDLWRIAPTYIGGANSEHERQFQGWESVAGLQDVIRCMKEVVILPLLYPEFFSNLGLAPPRGVLLHGYPGTGKTLVVRALVGSCARGDRRVAYFARKGADCLGKYVGDAERQLRLLFQVAEKSQPSIIFFDEIDGLAPCRTKQQDQTHNSVVSTLLALMDGLKSRGSVIVIGATNRPDAVDPALRRPGRFDREIYFPLPSVKDREAILSLHTQKWPKPITGSLLKWVANRTVGFAGADLQALCTQTALISLRRSFPLQKVLSAAETSATDKKSSAIPAFSVDERDWLKALSCAPPPCSRRESGFALNDVVSSPLKSHLVPCLLQPLTRLLVCLHLDELVWLPHHLNKASTFVKNVIVSALDRRKVQSDNWWLKVDDLLQQVDVTNDIEKSLLLADVLLEDSDPCRSSVTEDSADEYSELIPSKSLGMGARSGLHQYTSTALSSKSGYQVLICGNPRSGQRHLASCLLHSFVGNVDVWKIDLASISHEGHGDMVHGLTRILMRAAGADMCMLYMPTIDLWAVETSNKASDDDYEPSSMEPHFSGNISCNGHFETDMEHGPCPSADVEYIQSQSAVKMASYLWTSFIEQVESIRVNTSLIILATSDVPFPLLPNRVRQFFGNEILNSSLSSPLGRKEPRFSVQLDGKFNHTKVISAFAATLTRDLAQQFIQLLHNENHIHGNSLEVKAYETIDCDADRVCHNKSCYVSPVNLAGSTNKTPKGKSSLPLAISTLGYQILCYPHFAELCWVTSKLKEGRCAKTSGPWKGWPFNTCIVRPINSTENAAAASSSGNIKGKESGLVSGLVAVGLSAYRGEYTSTREVCSDVRRVLEGLVRHIDDKIQAGKDRIQFVRVLSQVAYLDDMVSSWAHALQSLEVDTPISNANANMGQSDNKDGISEGDGRMLADLNVNGPELLEKSLQEIGAGDAGQSNPTDVDNKSANAGGQVAFTLEQPSHQVVLDDCSSPKHPSTPDEDHAESGHVRSVNLSNGFTESTNFNADGPCVSVGKQINERHSSHATGNFGGSASDVNYSCFYRCCSECLFTLSNLLLQIINIESRLEQIDSNVEDIHDYLASLSANFHSSLVKLSQDEAFCSINGDERDGYRKYCMCWKFKGLHMKKLDKLLVDCDCHATSKKNSGNKENSVISQGLDCRFVFKDGVVATLDPGIDASYHCKYEKLCLCFLIEWLVKSRPTFN